MEFPNPRLSPSLYASILLMFMACSVSSITGYQFKVGEKCGWTLNPNESYSHWAERNRFQVNDTLYFKYNKTIDSVLLVEKQDYDNCNATKELFKLEGGESVFKFDRSGPFFFITGNLTNCQNGQKLIVLVLAIRAPPLSLPASPSPSSPASSPPSSPSFPSPAVEPPAWAPSSPESSPTKKKSAGAAVFAPAAVLFSAVCSVMGLIIIN